MALTRIRQNGSGKIARVGGARGRQTSVRGRVTALTEVAMLLTRLEAGNGTALASSALPLAPGALMPEDTADVALFVGETEQAIYCAALDGRHSDGSLRAVLVQANIAVETGSPVAATIRLGTARTTTDLTLTAPPALPVLCLLPTDPAYLISTELLPYCAPATLPEGTPAVLSNILGAYEAAGDAQWGFQGNNAYRSLSLYEHTHSAYAEWIRTGAVKWWDRANRMAIEYISERPTGTSQAWYTMSAWAPIHYWTTGRTETRTHMISVAEGASFHWGNWAHTPSDGEDRHSARYLAAMIDAYRLGIPANECTFTDREDGSWAAELLSRLDMMLDVQDVSGKRGGSNYCGEQKNFMTGLALTTLIRYYEEVDADSRILDAVQDAADWMWTDSWNVGSEGFKYVSGTGAGWTVENGGTCEVGDGAGTIFPELNGLVAFAFAWLYRRTLNATYRTRYLALLDGNYLGAGNWTISPNWALRQFDQSFWFAAVGMGLFIEAETV